MSDSSSIDLNNITLLSDEVSDAWKICVLQGVYYGENEYNGGLGARISSIFVIGTISTLCTIFPLAAKRLPSLKIPLYGYLFARYFGTGVIISTAFIHLMDPAYSAIGPNTCVGMTGNWAIYSWAPAIILTSVFFIFLVDIISGIYVEQKYGVTHSHDEDIEEYIVSSPSLQHEHSQLESQKIIKKIESDNETSESISDSETELNFKSQFGAFLVLEFGVIFHSVMIGLNLGASGEEFKTLYIVLVFHQSFEGLGIGARLSAIEWPKSKPKWIPWMCCIVYGLVTPIAIAIGLGVRTTYMAGSYNANIIQGVLDAISSGILIYTGLVELLARDFIFDPHRTRNFTRLTFMIVTTLFGAGIMALLGKWA